LAWLGLAWLPKRAVSLEEFDRDMRATKRSAVMGSGGWFENLTAETEVLGGRERESLSYLMEKWSQI